MARQEARLDFARTHRVPFSGYFRQRSCIRFPFSLPISLLRDIEFARVMNQQPFGCREGWITFVSNRLRLAFDDDSASAELRDLANFESWKDKKFWLKRSTDVATQGSPPLKHKFQNVFAMTNSRQRVPESS